VVFFKGKRKVSDLEKEEVLGRDIQGVRDSTSKKQKGACGLAGASFSAILFD